VSRKRKKRAPRGDAAGAGADPAKAPEVRSSPFADALRTWEDDQKKKAAAASPGSGAGEGRSAVPKRGGSVERRAPGRRSAGATADPEGAAGTSAAPPAPRRSALADRYSYADRVALNDAYLGVRPLDAGDGEGRGGRTRGRRRRTGQPVPPAPAPLASSADQAARARLAALVAGGLRWRLDREEDGRLSALRGDADVAALDGLRGGRATPEGEIDLHGLRGDEAAMAVVRFVRAQQREGARVVRVITGKGLHAEAGVGVLRDRVVQELTDGGAAPFVLAFCTADRANGGAGALLLRLARR